MGHSSTSSISSSSTSGSGGALLINSKSNLEFNTGEFLQRSLASFSVTSISVNRPSSFLYLAYAPISSMKAVNVPETLL
jgi:hypothetical protein